MENLNASAFCLFGAKALLERLKSLNKEIKGVYKAEDVECIHRMRVASRRLRSALNIFQDCFPVKSAKKWRKQVRTITQSLGKARDTDVQILFLNDFISNLENALYQPGIKRILLRLKQQREKMQSEVIEVMEEFEKNGVIQDIEMACHEIISIAKLHKMNMHSKEVYQRAYLAISLRLEDLLSFEPYVNKPEEVEKLHSMRISAKRLRYTMEIFSELYEDKLENSIDAIKNVQTILGEFNDCVVWVEFLQRFLDEEKARTLEYFGNTRTFNRLIPGIVYLQTERKQAKEKLHNDFVEFWLKTKDENLWGKLLNQVLEPCLEK